MLMLIVGITLKLLGQPTPFLEHEVKVESIINNAKTLAANFNLFLLIILFPLYLSERYVCKYIINNSF